jgi:hypothetical protein
LFFGRDVDDSGSVSRLFDHVSNVCMLTKLRRAKQFRNDPLEKALTINSDNQLATSAA